MKALRELNGRQGRPHGPAGVMRRLLLTATLAGVLLAVTSPGLVTKADAASASRWRDVGQIGSVRVQAGKDTSRAFARQVAYAGLGRPCDGSWWQRSPVTSKRYHIRCLGIVRRGYTSYWRDGWTIPVWGGQGGNGSVIRVRGWIHGQAS
jgi:hypothetical protein